MTQYGTPIPLSFFPLSPDVNTGYVGQDNEPTLATFWPDIADTQGVNLPPTINDNDYIKSRETLTTVVLLTYVSAHGTALVDPNVDTGFSLKLRARKSVATDPASYQVTKSLYQGAVDENNLGIFIASVTTGPNIPPIYTTYTHALTAGEVALITDYTKLFFFYETVKS